MEESVCVCTLTTASFEITTSIRAIGSICEPSPSFPCGASPSGVRLCVCVGGCANLYECACALEQVCVCIHVRCSYKFCDWQSPLPTAHVTTDAPRVMKSDDNSWLKLCVLGRLLGAHTHTNTYTLDNTHGQRHKLHTQTHAQTHTQTHTHTHTHTQTLARTHTPSGLSGYFFFDNVVWAIKTRILDGLDTMPFTRLGLSFQVLNQV
jgi:hypothetical protein